MVTDAWLQVDFVKGTFSVSTGEGRVVSVASYRASV